MGSMVSVRQEPFALQICPEVPHSHNHSQQLLSGHIVGVLSPTHCMAVLGNNMLPSLPLL